MSGYLVTGATGFVGGALVLELLQRTDRPVVCLVRGTAQAPWIRLERTLEHAAAAYGYRPGFVAAHRDRIQVAAGDLDDIALPAGVTIEEVWHCAASLKFDDKDRAEIFGTNVGGTQRVLETAERLGAGVFHYVSTAYVAGRRTGPIAEDHMGGAVDTNNLYEQSKVDAEQLVAATAQRYRIWRPSIVVGHSRTLAATAFSGMYGVIRELARFADLVHAAGDPVLERHSLRLRADPEGTLNFIPVDYAVGRAVELSLSGVDAQVVHLTNELAPTVGECFELLFDELRLSQPTYVGPTSQLERLDSLVDSRLSFYGSYLSGPKQFQQRTGAAYGGVLRYEFDRDTLLQYVRWYLRHLQTGLQPGVRVPNPVRG
ncbi:MAG: hypothetical protein JWN03_4673 [Nocardia sp.]|uniref:SDR family oxidoreductase n=1 Tax=Nocardia sp. TaxID=1821 RepID=UPI0026025EFD|nr:SDR family oxidoreductase [Nocardia sp.]MCU1644398.1 hypothetical protein [Nocardia sp.]